MSTPESLHDQNYLDQLARFRNEALAYSSYGCRRQIGKISFGSADVLWHTESDGSALLTERGLRFGSIALFNSFPTILKILDPAEHGSMFTEYKMDIDDIGTINVHRTIVDSASSRSILRFEAAKFKERQHDLDIPTDSDRLLLYQEMERAASGLYTI